jgi:dihydropyrimidinase
MSARRVSAESLQDSKSVCLTGGLTLLPGRGLVEADVHVENGRIAAIVAPGFHTGAEEVVSVQGLAILPGMIDAHLHLGHGMDIGRPREPGDADTETAAAAAGGVTTFIPYARVGNDVRQGIDEITSITEAAARIDFGWHLVFSAPEQLAQIENCVALSGVPTVKFFMNSRGNEGARLGLPHFDDGMLFQLAEAVGRAGGMLCPHAENIEIAWVLNDRQMKADPDGALGLQSWNAVKPPLVEAESVSRVCYIGRTFNTPIYNVHISSTDALRAAVDARRAGATTFIETCIHYLLLDDQSPVGVRAKVNPPIRTKEDQSSLWRAIADGQIDVVGTDHIHRPASCKEGGLWKASPGFPSLETVLPAFLTEGRRRGIDLPRLSDLVSRNPAMLMGLAPRKGSISVGADADLAIIDLNAQWTMDSSRVISSAGYSVLDGFKFDVRVVHTLVRGRFVLRDGDLQDDARGWGRFFARRLKPDLLSDWARSRARVL